MVERQVHGFDFEELLRKKKKLLAEGYSSPFDARDKEGKPHQIKTRGKSNALDLGSANRLKDCKEDFTIHVGTWEKNRSGNKKIVDTKSFEVNTEKLRGLLPPKKELERIKERMDKFRNPDAPGFQDLLHEQQEKNKYRIAEIRLKKDHHGQSRIQVEIPLRKIPDFEQKVKKKKLFGLF